MAGINSLAASILQMNNMANLASPGNNSSRNLYPAKVESIEDPLGQNRIKARIVTLDNEGKIIGGKDRDKLPENLVYCIPLLPEFFHVRPLVGEMVFVILENPSDDSSPRYWIGPIISSQLKLKRQSYEEAVKIFDYTPFNVNLATNNDFKVNALLPQESDVAVQGRDDADLILKSRQAILTAGKFNPNSVEPNVIAPSNLILTQFDNNKIGPLKTFSQANFQSSNINIYSPIGKFRDQNISKFETNENLKSFGDLANSLHPAVLGDELIKLLDLIITVLLTHIHTPQNPLLEIPQSTDLQEYTIDGKLQNIISNVVRIN